MGEDVRPAAALVGKRYRGSGDRRRELEGIRAAVRAEPRICAGLPAGWQGASGGTDLSQPRTGRDATAVLANTDATAFYRGPTAQAILQLSRELGMDFLQAADLADFQPEWVEPVSTTYHGWTVWEMPAEWHRASRRFRC